jgi:ubiquinone/menaquinone biosynthesis C-methylase UbiE
MDEKVKYHNFGYIPTGSIRDIRGKLFGHLNLLKRLQAKDIMKALNIQPRDLLLDFGCGSGYMTVEMAKVAQKAYGIDVIDYIEKIQIPEKLKGQLEFIKTSGTRLPFLDNTFDKILASEVLPMIPDPTQFLSEMRRVLKPEGLLVIVNGGGHPTIKEAFEKKSLLYRVFHKIYSGRLPKSYEEYCSALQKSFKTAQNHFLEEENIRELVIENDFDVVSVDYTPGHWAGAYLSWSQFILYLKTGRTLSEHWFVPRYYFFTFLRWFEKRKYRGGIIYVAKKR